MEGLHLTADCFDCQCDPALLLHSEILKKLLKEITIQVGLTIVGERFHGFQHADGSAAGVTGTLLLAESHVAIHTWPERRAVTLDVYVCNFESDNSAKAEKIVTNLIHTFQPKKIARQQLQRGEISDVNTNKHVHEHLSSYSFMGTQIEQVLEQHQSPLQAIEIALTPDFGKVMRIDGAMMTSEKDEFFYHECLVHPAAITHGAPKTALIIGGGDGGSTEELLKYHSIEKIVLCEIDSAVVDVAKQHLANIHRGAFDSHKLQLVYQDGVDFVKKSHAQFDLILLDLTDPITPHGSTLAGSCLSEDFFIACKNRLSERGLLVLHLGSPFYHAQRFSNTLAQLSTVFTCVRPYTVFIPLYGALWGMAIVGNNASEDPTCLSEITVNQRLKHHQISALQYYNAQVHPALFALPNYMKALLPSTLKE